MNYPPPICAARGSDATIDCNFTYPQDQQVQQVLWCSMTSNHDNCPDKPYIYDSEANNNQNNFQYIGNKTTDCSLLIRNINQTHSGEYRFRFITSADKWTGNPGVNILVHGKYKRFTLKNYCCCFVFTEGNLWVYGVFVLLFDRFKSVHEQVKRKWKHNSWRLFEFDMHTQVFWWFSWGSVV